MPPGLVLRQVQKNEVLEIVIGAGLDPADFDWSSRTYTSGAYSGPVDLLSHRSTNYFFEFSLRKDQHYSRMSPGPDSIEAQQFPGSWAGQLDYVQRWAFDLGAELVAPDLWDSITHWGSIDELPFTLANNTRFTASEIAQLGGRLDVIAARLAEAVDREDLRLQAEGLVQHLREESRRQGRFDWFSLAVGSVMTFMANAAFDPTRARAIINTLYTGIRSLGPG